MTIRVLLAEDHDLVRQGIAVLLNGLPQVRVVGEAATGLEAVALAEATPAEILLLDLSLPELHGLEVLTRVRKAVPDLKVCILTMHRDEEYAAQALRAGAAGYVTKDASADELREALHTVVAGRTHLSGRLAGEVVEAAMRRPSDRRLDALTPRQREVLQLVAEGCTTREIAARLGISPKTVEVHRTHLMQRLNIHDIAGLTRLAIAEGLIAES